MRSEILVAAFLCVGTLAFASPAKNIDGQLKILEVKNLTEYLRASSQSAVRLLDQNSITRAQIRYTHGSRVSGKQ